LKTLGNADSKVTVFREFANLAKNKELIGGSRSGAYLCSFGFQGVAMTPHLWGQHTPT
jgi:hypothetical protein